MIRRWLAALAVAACAAGLVAPAQAEVPVPALKARVTDLTGTLSAGQVGALEQRLAAFEAKKGSQIAVLMLPTTQPESIEQYSLRVAEAWKIGRKGTDDGLVLVVAKDDRRLRIEVGYGLEGAIPDAMAKRVISEAITPKFKAGDFYGGVSAGVEQLIRLVDGEKLPPPSGSGSGRGGMDPFDYIVPGIVFVLVVGSLFKMLLGRLPGAVASGIATGLLGGFLFSTLVGGIAAFAAFVLTLINLDNLPTGSGGGGFSSGGGGSSSSSSDWGGGGGSFGGGGSSGSW
jgi:uncharacterized protein